MKIYILKYGLISGLVLATAVGLLTYFVSHRIGALYSMAVTYTVMVLSFLIVFVGVKHYRDNQRAGFITFGRAFLAGSAMMLIACACYVLMWEGMVATVEKNFAHDYAASMVRHAQKSGLQGPALQAQIDAAHQFETQYADPLYRMSMTLLEPLPVGIIMALVTAGILRRKPQDANTAASVPQTLTT